MGVRNFSSTEVYANRLDLDKLPVFLERSGTDPMFLEVSGIPEILTYGKHYITVSFKDSSNSQYYLRNGSKLSFEVKDSDGNIVFSEIADLSKVLVIGLTKTSIISSLILNEFSPNQVISMIYLFYSSFSIKYICRNKW